MNAQIKDTKPIHPSTAYESQLRRRQNHADRANGDIEPPPKQKRPFASRRRRRKRHQPKIVFFRILTIFLVLNLTICFCSSPLIAFAFFL